MFGRFTKRVETVKEDTHLDFLWPSFVCERRRDAAERYSAPVKKTGALVIGSIVGCKYIHGHVTGAVHDGTPMGTDLHVPFNNPINHLGCSQQ